MVKKWKFGLLCVIGTVFACSPCMCVPIVAGLAALGLISPDILDQIQAWLDGLLPNGA